MMDYGVDSLMAVNLIVELDKIFQTTLKASVFLNYPTINSLGKYLASLEVEKNKPKQEVS